MPRPIPLPTFDPAAPKFNLPEIKLKDSRHWRLRAEEVRSIADDASDPIVLGMLLRLAADYDRLAEATRKSDARD
jgi:hypothetical protein